MYTKPEQIKIVVGGQYGSECKGAVCARLHVDSPGMMGIRIGGSQAGHSAVDKHGKKWALRHVPVAAVVDNKSPLVIAAGSEIDLAVLYDEIKQLEAAGFAISPRLHVDSEATVIFDRHKKAEQKLTHGTTAKGVGAARAERAMRQAVRIKDLSEDYLGNKFCICDTQQYINSYLERGLNVLIEGVQGYALGSHAGHYPHSTSGDCRAIDFMAMAGIAPAETETWVVLRTHPIRIAGNSGPMENETNWAELGLDEEITTVTKKVRRVAQWDIKLAQNSVRANGGSKTKIALMTADYKYPQIAGLNTECWPSELESQIKNDLQELQEMLNAKICMLGTGPASQIRLDTE